MSGREFFKKNPAALTPSKAAMLASGGAWPFIQRYVLKEYPETKEAMELGTNLHEMFYKLLKAKILQGPISKELILEDFNDILAFPPKVWLTKKESGVSISDQKANFKAKATNAGKIVLTEKMEPIFRSMVYFIGWGKKIKKLQEDKDLKFEKLYQDKDIAGVFDIYSPRYNLIIDIKTKGKDVLDFGRYDEFSLAVQQIFYQELLLDKKPDFVFLVIQTSWPYTIKWYKLPYKYILAVKNKALSLRLEYQKFLESLHEAIPKPFGKKTAMEKQDAIEQLLSHEIISFDDLSTVDIKPWAYSSMVKTPRIMHKKVKL